MPVIGQSKTLIAAVVFFAPLLPLLLSFKPPPFAVTVHDVTNSPIPQAKARLLSLNRVFELKSGANGDLNFTDIVPGTYDLEVSASGFRQRSYPDLHIPDSDCSHLDVLLDRASIPDHCGYVNAVDYQPATPEARNISGYIVDEDTGKGLRDVTVELKDVASGSQAAATATGLEGAFALSNVPPGRYNLRASKNAYEPTEMTRILVPRENLTILHLGLDKRGHMHVCQ